MSKKYRIYNLRRAGASGAAFVFRLNGSEIRERVGDDPPLGKGMLSLRVDLIVLVTLSGEENYIAALRLAEREGDRRRA